MPISSFSPISFSPLSFDTTPAEDGGAGHHHRGNRFRAWIAGWARDFRNFFKIKQRPPPPEDVEIPPAQPPKIFHILPDPPTMETKLETLNDKWEMPPTSVVASVPVAAESAAEPIYPLILNPLVSPLVQKKVTLPRATRHAIIPPYRVGEGSHIESEVIELKIPRNRSKTASTINTLMILLEIESKL
jgi:hypothetical protein